MLSRSRWTINLEQSSADHLLEFRSLHLHLASSVSRDSVAEIQPFTREPQHPHAVIVCPQNEQGFITKYPILPVWDFRSYSGLAPV
ncbi:hypothetical protein TNCV_1491121 [Trichonephila clavipes]|nr:hypothetical protein TNCV_1491121 [Trichonephila clavipes]